LNTYELTVVLALAAAALLVERNTGLGLGRDGAGAPGLARRGLGFAAGLAAGKDGPLLVLLPRLLVAGDVLFVLLLRL
jgi:hypothetical protein